jgi:phosphatidylserine/phosphatidylglycerophosphate/cardiolipin synthase-like enzyme
LRNIQDVFAEFDRDEIQINRDSLQAKLLNETSATEGLTLTEFNAVMVSLSNTPAATELKTTSGGYGKYTFTVSPQQAVQVLDQQLTAALALQQLQRPETPATSVKLVATLPREVERGISDDVGRLDIALRRMLMDAAETVRVANPYFDPDQWIVEDLAALPKRGVETRVLTREATGESADERTLDAVTALVNALGPSEIRNVMVRDFYETSRSGHQTGAVHAKIITVDDERCYIGSANLTDLNLRGNFEFGVILEGELVHEVVEVFDAIFARSTTVPL